MGSMGHGGMGGGSGMRAADAPSRGTGRATAAELTAQRPKPKFKEVWPEIWALIKPRKWLLLGCFFLMCINRSSGLVLPALFKPLIDQVMHPPYRMDLLPGVVSAAVLATVIQGWTSFLLTQILSKSGQRLIADLRMQVQNHVGRLPVSYYDATRSGTLVSRIMNDVEGVRNLVGTGVMDLVGGLLAALFEFIVLIHLSRPMTLL